ncbi:MAG: hypothetical protein ACJ762_17885 [Solirubrobacteraceae bacterium]
MSRAVLTALTAAAGLAVAGCGGGGEDTKPGSGLSWEGTPKVFRAKNLPDDRVVIARVKNDGDTTLHLIAKNLKVRDASGTPLLASAAFTTNYAHGLFGMLQQPKPVPPAELIRLGKVAFIPAGASVPFYAAWRLKPGAEGPFTVDYGKGTLVLPDATGVSAGR